MNSLYSFKAADLIDEIPGIVIFLDEDFKILEVSSDFIVNSGLVKDEIIGFDVASLIHPLDSTSFVSDAIDLKTSSSEFFRSQFRLKSSVDKYVYVDAKIKKIDMGNIEFVFSASNITDLRSKELSNIAKIEKYRQLERIANIGLWEVDLIRNTLYWSEQTYSIHKLNNGDVLTINEAVNFYHPEDRPTITKLVENCAANGVAFNEKLRLIDALGAIVCVEVRGQAIYNQEGKVFKIHGTFQDISCLVEQEEDKKKNKYLANTYQLMIDEFAIVAKTDIDGNITYVNDQFCKISKYSRSELIGKNHRILNSGEHPQEFWQDMWSTVKSGETWRSDVCNKAKDESIYWVDTFITPLLNESNIVTELMVIRVDITEQKNNEKSLSIEREKATFASQLATIGEMSAGIAHEINNPLAVIAGNIDMISIKMDKGKTKGLPKNIETIKKSVNRISKIIKGLKRVSYKSESNELEKVSMHEIMSDTLDFSLEMLRSKGIELVVEDLPDCFVECRSVEISQVLLNLVNNAKDAIADLPSKWIKVQSFQVKDKLRINVIDSGSGISAGLREKIMESFFTTKELGEGTGLGLSLSKRIIEEHEGEFFIDSDSENTCFSIILPIAK